MGTGNGLSSGRSIRTIPKLRPQRKVKEDANIELEINDTISLEETTLNEPRSILPRGLHHDKLKSRMLERELLKPKGLDHDKLKSRMPERELLKPKGLDHDKKIMKKMPVKKAKDVKTKLKMSPAKMHGLMNDILYKK